MITDAQVRRAWLEWEQPDTLIEFLDDWRSMDYDQRVAFFTAMILPRICGPQARWVPVGRVLAMGLATSYDYTEGASAGGS